MKRVLITGMSGVGKSSVLEELRRHGHAVADTDYLLSVAAETMAHRLATRTNNPYGQGPGEIEESLQYKETVEPKLREIATIEIDTSPPLPDVVDAVLHHLGDRVTDS